MHRIQRQHKNCISFECNTVESNTVVFVQHRMKCKGVYHSRVFHQQSGIKCNGLQSTAQCIWLVWNRVQCCGAEQRAWQQRAVVAGRGSISPVREPHTGILAPPAIPCAVLYKISYFYNIICNIQIHIHCNIHIHMQYHMQSCQRAAHWDIRPSCYPLRSTLLYIYAIPCHAISNPAIHGILGYSPILLFSSSCNIAQYPCNTMQ